MMNFANDINVYDIYAQMAMFNSVTYNQERPYFCFYIGRRDGMKYANDDAAMYAKYGNNIVMHSRMPELFSAAMGNEFYVARFADKEDGMKFMQDVYEKVKEVNE